VKSPLDIKIACYLDVKVPLTKLKRRSDGLIQTKKEMEGT